TRPKRRWRLGREAECAWVCLGGAGCHERRMRHTAMHTPLLLTLALASATVQLAAQITVVKPLDPLPPRRLEYHAPQLLSCPVTLQRLDSSALDQWDRIAGRPVATAATRAGRPWRAWLLEATRLIAWALLVASLPFVALVKVAVVLYQRGGFPTALALAGGAA